MILTAQKNKKGFTLVELLVVMAIGIALFSTLGAGIIYLQNSVSLDNAIRNVKAEIQSAQNNARNSFVVNESLNSNSLATKKISVGWIVDLSNSGNNLNVIKRSVFFTPGNNYDFTLLRSHIETNLRNKNADFYCKNDVLYFKSSSSQGIVTFPGLEAGQSLKCSNEANERVETVINGINLHDESGGIDNCYRPDVDNNKRVSFFFTAGYGEASIFTTDTNKTCQIKIKNSGGIVNNSRAVYIYSKTGSIQTCGNYCIQSDIIPVIQITNVPEISIPSCASAGQSCGGGVSCCSGYTCGSNNFCQLADPPQCAPLNAKCGASTPCCTGYSCKNGICGGGTSIPPLDPF